MGAKSFLAFSVCVAALAYVLAFTEEVFDQITNSAHSLIDRGFYTDSLLRFGIRLEISDRAKSLERIAARNPMLRLVSRQINKNVCVFQTNKMRLRNFAIKKKRYTKQNMPSTKNTRTDQHKKKTKQIKNKTICKVTSKNLWLI